ncbi:MAG: hypothetical protein KJP03_00555, partial [Gammaproteobacteria bacterium]|nr:hypothetical protein [Gammaproteobacteria bacterium]
LCDADLDNSNLVNFADLSLLSEAFFADPAAPNWNPHADLNSDGIVNFADLQIMSSYFFQPPGPSGLINN